MRKMPLALALRWCSVHLWCAVSCGGDSGTNPPEPLVPAAPPADAAAPSTADAALPPATPDAALPVTPDAAPAPATPDAALPATPDAAPAPALACTATPRVVRSEAFAYHDLISDAQNLYYLRFTGPRHLPATTGAIVAVPLADLADAPARIVATIRYAPLFLEQDGPDLFWTGRGVSGMGGLFAIGKDGADPRTLASGSIRAYFVDGPSVYFQSSSSILRVARAGTGTPEVVTEAGSAHDLAGDATHLYWIDFEAEIRRVAKTGGASEVLAQDRNIGMFEIVPDGDRFLIGAAGIFALSKSGVLTGLATFGGRLGRPYRAGDFVYAHGFEQYIDDDEQYIYRLPAAGGAPVEIVRQGRGNFPGGLVFHGGCIYYGDSGALYTVAQ